MNFPTNHDLWQPLPVVDNADLILALDVGDLFNVLGDVADTPHRTTPWRIKPGTKVISIDSELLASSANYQDKMRFYQTDLPVAADAEASLPSLIEAVKRAMPASRCNETPAREERFRAAFRARREGDLAAAAIAWDATPISIATEITAPNIDYAKMAQGMGLYAEGPITSPADLGPAIARAIKVVKSGHPALLDVVTQPR